jgi:flavin-dependent dehydrogenase
MTVKEHDYLPDATNSCRLDVIIVGGGMGGLSASIQCALSGHHVTVIEAANELAEVRCYEDCFYSGGPMIFGDTVKFSQ